MSTKSKAEIAQTVEAGREEREALASLGLTPAGRDRSYDMEAVLWDNVESIDVNGSEPHLRDDEAVCEVTNLTYLKALGRSPHIDENGRPL